MSTLDLQRQQMASQGQGSPGGYGSGNMQQNLQSLQQQQGQTRGGGLPQGGLDAQMTSINEYYDQIRNARAMMPAYKTGSPGKTEGVDIGFDVQDWQAGQLGGQGQERGVQERGGGYSNDLNSLARKLAESYGLDIGRGQLVDERGNLMITPDQLQAQSGGSETLGSAAAKLNYLSAAITKEMNVQQQQKGIAALQTGLGQVNKRGRGSMAAMQSGLYQDLADMYSNQEFEAADYSYFIQKEQMDIAQELDRRAREAVKKRARGGFWSGLGITVAGLWTGNYGAAMQGAAQAGEAFGETGYEDRWF